MFAYEEHNETSLIGHFDLILSRYFLVLSSAPSEIHLFFHFI